MEVPHEETASPGPPEQDKQPDRPNAILPSHFDRSKPFYPIVLLYLTQLIGAGN